MSAIPAQTLLEESKCYLCYGVSQSEALKLGLLNRILSSGGSSSDFRAENYGGGQPTYVPVGTLGIAVDTSTEQIWWYYSGAWH